MALADGCVNSRLEEDIEQEIRETQKILTIKDEISATSGNDVDEDEKAVEDIGEVKEENTKSFDVLIIVVIVTTIFVFGFIVFIIAKKKEKEDKKD